MRKNFITNIGFLLFLNLLVKPFWILGIDRTVQNTLGPEVYGVYFALFNFSYLFQVVLDFGINNYNNRQVAQDPQTLGRNIMSTLVLKLLLGVVYTIIVFIAAFGVQFSGEQFQILGLLVLMQIALSFYTFLRSNVNALHLFRTDAVLSILDKLTTSILCAWIFWGASGITMSIPLFIWIQIGGFVVAILVAVAVLSRQKLTISNRIDKALIKNIFKGSLPYALLGFLMTAYYRTDGVMLERMLGDKGPYQAGIYASAFRLLDAMSILGFLMAGMLMPMFARMISQNTSVKPLLDLGFQIMLICSISAGIACLIHREDIMQLLYHVHDPSAGSIFGWLMASFICISLTYVYGSLITAHGSIKMLNYISFGGFILNIILNLMLIPEQQALGSAKATVFAQVLILLAHIAVAHRLFSLGSNLSKWLRSLFYLAAVIGVNLLIAVFNISWTWQWVIGLASGAFLAIPAGIINMTEVRSLKTVMQSAIARRQGS